MRLASAVRASAGVAVAFAVGLVWPTAEPPFSTPKRMALIGAAAIAALAFPWGTQRPPRSAWFLLVASLLTVWLGPATTFEAGALVVAFAVVVIGWSRWPIAHERVFLAAAVAGAITSTVTVLQITGFDVFTSWAPDITGARLAAYGTLGNPDFVASVVTLTLGLTFTLTRWWRWPLAAVQFTALIATRSFATWGAVALALLVALVHRRRAPSKPHLAIVATIAVVMFVSGAHLSLTRSLPRALEGRR